MSNLQKVDKEINQSDYNFRALMGKVTDVLRYLENKTYKSISNIIIILQWEVFKNAKY